MNPTVRRRLIEEMERANYRAKVARQLGVALALLAIFALIMAHFTSQSIRQREVIGGAPQAGAAHESEIPKLSE